MSKNLKDILKVLTKAAVTKENKTGITKLKKSLSTMDNNQKEYFLDSMMIIMLNSKYNSSLPDMLKIDMEYFHGRLHNCAKLLKTNGISAAKECNSKVLGAIKRAYSYKRYIANKIKSKK